MTSTLQFSRRLTDASVKSIWGLALSLTRKIHSDIGPKYPPIIFTWVKSAKFGFDGYRCESPFKRSGVETQQHVADLKIHLKRLWSTFGQFAYLSHNFHRGVKKCKNLAIIWSLGRSTSKTKQYIWNVKQTWEAPIQVLCPSQIWYSSFPIFEKLALTLDPGNFGQKNVLNLAGLTAALCEKYIRNWF